MVNWKNRTVVRQADFRSMEQWYNTERYKEIKKEEEKIVRIKVNINAEGVTINAADRDDAFMSCLLNITDRVIIRSSSVNPKLGFGLDEEGRLRTN